jgi:predicted RNA-binding Zn-ribbon protein involved in translation (DUF1610 family)
MVEDKKKVVMVVIVVVCLGLAAVIAVINFGGGGGGGAAAAGPVLTLCVNPDCGHTFEMTSEERRQQMLAKGRAAMRRGGGPPAFTCPQCGEESAYQANKCSKCNTVFIADYTSGDFSDKCPECGYSAIEERRAAKEQ